MTLATSILLSTILAIVFTLVFIRLVKSEGRLLESKYFLDVTRCYQHTKENYELLLEVLGKYEKCMDRIRVLERINNVTDDKAREYLNKLVQEGPQHGPKV